MSRKRLFFNYVKTKHKKQILYLCFNYPFPPKIGEEHGFIKHIEELTASKYKNFVKFVFLNTNNNNGTCSLEDISIKVFQPNICYKSKILKQLVYFIHILFSTYPKNFTEIITKDYAEYVNRQNSDVTILDSIYSYRMLPKIINGKLIYISHNIESKLYNDIAKLETNFFKHIYKKIYAKKIQNIENKLLKKADCIVSISNSDYNYLKKLYPNKIYFLPYKLKMNDSTWEVNNSKTLFFCGPTTFSPNYEAIKWIVEELAPVLSDDIKIKIAGKGTNTLPHNWQQKNIEYLGFVSDEELHNLYKTSSAFICPIVYGSGIKIKITEAFNSRNVQAVVSMKDYLSSDFKVFENWILN